MIPNALTNYISQKVFLSEKLTDEIILMAEELQYSRNHFLLKEGSIPHYLWFIAKGSVRVFYEYEDKEVTSWIYNQNQIVTAYGNFFSRTASYDNIQCTEDCTVIRLSYEKLQKLYGEYPEMQQFGRVWMEEIVTVLDNFYKGFMFMSAKDKYDLLFEVSPRSGTIILIC